jgi:protein-L-isoaspartate(D-aspartate) O-methyltransferase
VEVITGDAAIDWSDGGPWDAILVTGSMPNDPSGLIGRLAEGGRLVAVVGDAPVMRAIRFTREAAGVRRESLFETIVPPLKNAPQPKRFSF